MPSSILKSNNLSVVDKIDKSNEGEGEVGCGIQTPVDLKTKLVRGKKKNPRWRKSIS